jgi:hypothetical protein
MRPVVALRLFVVRHRAHCGRPASSNDLKQAHVRIQDRFNDRSVRVVFANRIRGHTTLIMLARVGLLIENRIDLYSDNVKG